MREISLQKEIDKKYPYIINSGSCNYTTMGTEITFDQFKKYVLKWDHVCFKPSSKSDFDAQNQSKTIEKWSVGSYVVLTKEYGALNIGEVHEIGSTYSGNCVDVSISVGSGTGPLTVPPVLLTVSTILAAAVSKILCSYAFNLIRTLSFDIILSSLRLYLV